jgi:hypothetical protein
MFLAYAIKNCEPLVSGPLLLATHGMLRLQHDAHNCLGDGVASTYLLAMETIPRALCCGGTGAERHVARCTRR